MAEVHRPRPLSPLRLVRLFAALRLFLLLLSRDRAIADIPTILNAVPVNAIGERIRGLLSFENGCPEANSA